MTGPGVALLEAVACVGLGALVLRLLGLMQERPLLDRIAWSFAIGFGVLGWLLFFVGVGGGFSVPWVGGLLAVSTAGMWALRGGPSAVRPASFGRIEVLLLTAIAFFLAVDLMEGLAPPADADSMAYHFATPKLFWQAGRIEFIPRAVDGAIPMLVHMTYVPALSLGGETGLTLWAMLSGWGAVVLLYVFARQHLPRPWALTTALLFLGTPAVLYGGGTGQVETRLALFVMVGAYGVAQAVRTGDLGWAALAGLGAGFFMGGKYTGLLFGLACGLPVLVQRRWFVNGLTLTLVAFLAGGQWYAWNWLHTGDPVFPMLYGLVDYTDPNLWDPEHRAALRDLLDNEEKAVPNSLLWLVTYPFAALVNAYPVFEGARTGLGPFPLLVLPFAALGLWHRRRRLLSHPLAPVVAVAVIFYAAWFLSGSSQRVRHLLPVYPLILLALTVAGQRGAAWKGGSAPLVGAVVVTVGLQAGFQGLMGLNHARHVLGSEHRDAYLRRNLAFYEAVAWANDNLDSDDKVFIIQRHLLFHLDVPYFYAHYAIDPRIDIRKGASDGRRFCSQLQAQGVTHLLVTGPRDTAAEPRYRATSNKMWRQLDRGGCVVTLKSLDTRYFASRTLNMFTGGVRQPSHIMALKPDRCSLCRKASGPR